MVSHFEHTSSLVFGSSPSQFYVGSLFRVLRTLKSSKFLLPSLSAIPKANPTTPPHKTRAAFLDSRLTAFSRFYKTSYFFRLVRDRAESQVSNKDLTTKLQFVSVFFHSGWGTYMRKIILSLHDTTVTNTFFLRHKIFLQRSALTDVLNYQPEITSRVWPMRTAY